MFRNAIDAPGFNTFREQYEFYPFFPTGLSLHEFVAAQIATYKEIADGLALIHWHQLVLLAKSSVNSAVRS